MSTRPSLPGEYPEVLLQVRERLKGQYKSSSGYSVRPGVEGQPFDLQVRVKANPLHYFIIHDGGSWEALCVRLGRCIEHAEPGGATVWLVVPDSCAQTAKELTPRVCSYRQEGGELFFQW